MQPQSSLFTTKLFLRRIDLNQFNQLYQGMILYDWHFDDDLSLYTRRGNDYLPGDCLYFKNPDFNPETPQWRGENAISLGNGLYYGHGIGIKDANGIIEALHKKRRPGATESAFLLSQVTRLDSNFLYNFSSIENRGIPAFLQENNIVARIGFEADDGRSFLMVSSPECLALFIPIKAIQVFVCF